MTTYLFAGLPDNLQTRNLKLEMMTTMEDRFNELRFQGKSEHEAIGII